MESLGEFLKQGREDAGLTLEDLAQRTRIRIENLEALEREDLDALPTDIYVRGFVKLVCRELGLAPEDGLVRYQSIRSAAGPADEIIWSEEREVAEPGWLERALKDPERVVRVAASTVKWGGLGVGVVLVALAVWAGLKAFRGDGDPSSAPAIAAEAPKPEVARVEAPPAPEKPDDGPKERSAPQEPVKTQLVKTPKEPRAPVELALAEPEIPERRPAGTIEAGDPVAAAAAEAAKEEMARVEAAKARAAKPEPTKSRSQAPRTSPPAVRPARGGDRLVLVVEALRPVHVEVLLDGIGAPRSQTLAAGEAKTWKADSLFLLSATDGGAVRVTLDGVDLGVPGHDGEPLLNSPVRPGP